MELRSLLFILLIFLTFSIMILQIAFRKLNLVKNSAHAGSRFVKSAMMNWYLAMIVITSVVTYNNAN